MTLPGAGARSLLPTLDTWIAERDRVALADLGYEGKNDRLICPIKTHAKVSGQVLTAEQRTINMLHSATRAVAERGNSLLETTFKALRRVSLCPWRSARSPPLHSSCSMTRSAP